MKEEGSLLLALPDMELVKRDLAFLKRVDDELPEESIRENGQYHTWYMRLKRQTKSLTEKLCREFFLAPFRIPEDSEDAAFSNLLSEEMDGVKSALKKRDGGALEDALRDGYRRNLEWVVTHGGLASTRPPGTKEGNKQ